MNKTLLRQELQRLVGFPMVREAAESYLKKIDRLDYISMMRTYNGNGLSYPIYIPTKNRARWCSAGKLFSCNDIGFVLVIEKQDEEKYLEKYDKEKLLILPKNDMGLEYARNYIKKLSISRSDSFHWQVDDDIAGFSLVLGNNPATSCHPVRAMKEVEDFCSRYSNIAVAGPSNSCFLPSKFDPLFNKLIASCILVNNNCPTGWTEGVIDDIDFCLSALTAGWCTVKFTHVLMQKAADDSMAGWNESRYAKRVSGLMLKWPNVFSLHPITGKLKGSRVWKTFKQELVLK